MTDELPVFDFSKAITKSADLNKPNSILLYGDPKGGKSWLAASISKLGKTLLLDTEGGAASVARDWPDVDVVQIDSFDKLEFILDKLLTTKHDYQSVILDTVGVAQARAEQHFMEDPECRNKYGAVDGFAVFRKLKDWLIQPTWVDRDGKKQGGVMWKLHEAPFTAIVVAHARDEKDDETGAVKTLPSVVGSAKEILSGIPDIIGYMTQTKQENELVRTLITRSGGRLTSGNRFGLPDLIPEPTMEKIYNFIKTPVKKESK